MSDSTTVTSTLSTDTAPKRGKSIQRSQILHHTDSDSLYLENQIELRPEISKSIGNIKIPSIFTNDGMPLLKISHKSKKRILFWIDPSCFKFSWRMANSTTTTTSATTSATTSGLPQGITNTTALSNSAIISTPAIATSAIHRLSITNRTTHEFVLDDIKSIYIQNEGSGYREELNISQKLEKNWITIIYFNHKKNSLKSLHLITDNDRDFKKLILAIYNLKQLRSQLAKEFLIDLNELDENYVKMLLNKELLAGDNGNVDGNEVDIQKSHKHVREFLSFNDILKYSKRLNINVNTNHLQQIFDQVLLLLSATTEKPVSTPLFEKGLNFEQFKQFVSILKDRKDLQEIWDSLAQGKEVLQFDEIKNFIINIQKENFSDDDDNSTINLIFQKYCSNDNGWNKESLNEYLLSSYSTPYREITQTQTNYYDYPLNEYFISSSHNTYLTGRQVAGDSSVEGYIRTLQRGCRCVEIDIWNGDSNTTTTTAIGTKDDDDKNEYEPIVNHGRTFTKPISFANVIRAIKKFAFIVSPWPLILSLEIHCSPECQIKVVNILKDILGENMIIAPIDIDSVILPSPAELKHKFIIKVKKTTSFQNLIETENGSFTTSTTTTTTTTTTTATSLSEDNENNKSNSSSTSSFIIRRRKNKSPKIINELSNLGIYTQGIKFRNFSLPESKTFNHCFSLGEKSINRMIKDDDKKISLDKHNRRYLMRVYPLGTRLKSSNFNPLPYWSHGVQMVATNWQTYDLGQQLNEALFENKIFQGYVLKPSVLRKPTLKSSSSNVDTRTSLTTTNSKTIRFNFEIISGHQLPKFPKDDYKDQAINPYISFEIIGAQDVQWANNDSSPIAPTTSSSPFIRTTKIIRENGFNPNFNTKFSGSIITTTNDLIFIKFVVYASTSLNYPDYGENFPIAILVTKLNYLKQGYRYIYLNDLLGEQLVYSSIFIKIEYDEDLLNEFINK